MAQGGLFIVLSSPSGAGKTTICSSVITADKARKLFLSISTTTRTRRSSEVDGQDYHFVSMEEFQAQEKQEAFLESADAFGNLYGTPRAPINKALKDDKDILFDIDWQGAQALAKSNAERLVRVFVLPPSAKDLAKRMTTRAQDSADARARRMAGAAREVEHYMEYDYVLVNNDLEETVARVQAIIAAERARRERQPQLALFVKELVADLKAYKA